MANKMLNFYRAYCTAIKNKLKEEISTNPRHKFISHVPLFELENPKFHSRIRHSLKHRCSDIDFDQIKLQHDLLRNMERILSNLESAKKGVNQKYNKTVDKDLIEKIQYEGRLIREDIKSLKEVLVTLRDDVNFAVQSLPNFVHDRVPLGTELDIIYEQGGSFENPDKEKPEFPSCTFSTGKDAWLDLLLPIKAIELLNEQGFVQTSNPDFLRLFTTRAAGISDQDMCQIYEEDSNAEDQTLSLVGGGSFASFLPYIAKLSLYPSAFPLKLIAMGREYGSFLKNGEKMPSQAQTVQLLNASKDENEALDQLDDIIEIYKNYYATYGQSFRLSYAPARNLSQAETLRVDVEIESAYTNEFVTVANIRYFSDYISKRMLFNYKIDKRFAFPHLIGGTFLHLPHLLSAINTDSIELDSYFTQ